MITTARIYRILGLVIIPLIAGLLVGHKWAERKAQAERTVAAERYAKQMAAAKVKADELTVKLEEAEAKVIVKTVEVIRYVPKVTTGRLCLDSAAVSLLQPGASPTVTVDAAGELVEAGPPVAAASDRDVAYWVAGANERYETCAARLNALIDWHEAP